jgi:hypothetical protein
MHDPTLQRQQQIDLARRLVFARNKARRDGRLVRNVDLADYFDVSAAAVGLWYRTGKIDSTKLPELAKLFNVDVTWLITGEGGPDPTDADSADEFDAYVERKAHQVDQLRQRHDLPHTRYIPGLDAYEMRYVGRPNLPSRRPRPLALADAEDLIERYEQLPREGRRIIEAALQIAEHLFSQK